MPNEYRLSSVGGLWFLATIALSAVFIGAGLQGELTMIHIAFASIIVGFASVATMLLLRWFKQLSDSDISKAKRERIDNLLRDMSDAELLELKKRLSDGDYDEDALLDYVSDDGELVFRE